MSDEFLKEIQKHVDYILEQQKAVAKMSKEERRKRLESLYGSITDDTFKYHKKFLYWENKDD